jgi:hypothetical protein
MFKIGDKVKVVANPANDEYVEDCMGYVGKVVKVYEGIGGYGLEEGRGQFYDDEIELVGPKQLTFVFRDR